MNEALRFVLIQANRSMLSNDGFGCLSHVENDETGQRATLQGGGAFKQRLIVRSNPGNKAS